MAWLQTLITENNPSRFPYHYACTEGKTIRLSESVYQEEERKNPSVFNPKKGVAYVLTIPFLATRPLEKSAEKLNHLAGIIQKQAFYEKEGDPSLDVKSKVLVIFGINCPYSVDQEENEAFIRWVQELPKVKEINALVMGRFWHPKICPSNTITASRGKKELEWERKAVASFTELKAQDRNLASQVQNYLCTQKFSKRVKGHLKETNKTRIAKQIPFQQIREWLKDITVSIVQPLVAQPDAPSFYLGSLDSDTISLNGEGTEVGLLRFYDRQVLSSTVPPQLMSTGYFFPQQTDSITLLANKIDMTMRNFIASTFPLGVYFPEPNLFLLLNELFKEGVTISFVGGTGNDTEARRLLENLSDHLQCERVKFIAKRCLITTPPKRMIASKQRQLAVITYQNLLENETLKSLRGISQTHFKPTIWSSNLYSGLKIIRALPQEIKKVKATTKIFMAIFSLFDIPTLAINSGLLAVIKVYKDYVTGIHSNWEIISQSEMKEENLKIPPAISKEFFLIFSRALNNQINSLRLQNFSENAIAIIVGNAIHAGWGVYETFVSDVK